MTPLVGFPETWWTNQKFSLVNIIAPWLYMLIYYLGDEK
jgi:hypothetical protein